MFSHQTLHVENKFSRLFTHSNQFSIHFSFFYQTKQHERKRSRGYTKSSYMFILSATAKKESKRELKEKLLRWIQIKWFCLLTPSWNEIGCFQNENFSFSFFIADKHTEMDVSRNILKRFFFFVSFSPRFLFLLLLMIVFHFLLCICRFRCCAPVAFGT